MDGQDEPFNDILPNPLSIAVVWREVLHGIFPTIGRLALLAQCWDSGAALYSDNKIREYPSLHEASSAISAVHELVWQDWLQGSFDAQRADLLAYLDTLPSPSDRTLAIWTVTQSYLNFVPISATRQNREAFAGRMEELVAYLGGQRLRNVVNLGRGERRATAGHLVERVLSLVHERYADPDLSLKAIGKDLHSSEHHLGKLFRTAMGLTFRQYLRQIRMQKAILLLEGQIHGIKTVCSLVGYRDLSHFTQYFRQATGTTPAEYRNEKQRRAHSA